FDSTTKQHREHDETIGSLLKKRDSRTEHHTEERRLTEQTDTLLLVGPIECLREALRQDNSGTADTQPVLGAQSAVSREEMKDPDHLAVERLALLDEKRKSLEYARALNDEWTELWTLLTNEIDGDVL
ncbi:MAG: hypothetical protein ACKPKO_08040, partial [Candidatus Fonsibacter sp.]